MVKLWLLGKQYNPVQLWKQHIYIGFINTNKTIFIQIATFVLAKISTLKKVGILESTVWKNKYFVAELILIITAVFVTWSTQNLHLWQNKEQKQTTQYI